MTETTTPAAPSGTVGADVRLFNAIKDAVNEMDRCPDDSIQDIWNEMLDKWETGLRMDIHHNIEPNARLDRPETAGRKDCHE